MSGRRRIAIACQGGGSHTAFGAGVLEGLLARWDHDEDEVVALSGSSGGALCALLTWDGLLRNDPERAVRQLRSFWDDVTAYGPFQSLMNDWLQVVLRVRPVLPLPDVSPYAFPPWWQGHLRKLLERRLDFARLRELAAREGAPSLRVGAIDVLAATYRVFRGEEITVEALLASTAIPELFPVVRANGRLYWDGLYERNPPVRELTEDGPDEIWVVQMRAPRIAHAPRTVDAIADRRNQISGCLSIDREVEMIEKINDLMEAGLLRSDGPYRRIFVRRVTLDRDLDYVSMFDRGPRFVRHLMELGQEHARRFLNQRRVDGAEVRS